MKYKLMQTEIRSLSFKQAM